MGHKSSQGRYLDMEYRVRGSLSECRQILNISQSTGKLAEGAPLLLYQSMKRGDYRTFCHCSEAIRLWFWILIGWHPLCKRLGRTDWLHRSPFNDSLIASGSDDGKVMLNFLYSELFKLTAVGIHMESS